MKKCIEATKIGFRRRMLKRDRICEQMLNFMKMETKSIPRIRKRVEMSRLRNEQKRRSKLKFTEHRVNKRNEGKCA